MEALRDLFRGRLFIFDNELYITYGSGRKEGMVSVKHIATYVDGLWMGQFNTAVSHMDGDVMILPIHTIEGIGAYA